MCRFNQIIKKALLKPSEKRYKRERVTSEQKQKNKATKLYRVSNYSSIGESMDTYKFEYEYESIWGK